MKLQQNLIDETVTADEVDIKIEPENEAEITNVDVIVCKRGKKAFKEI